MLQCCFSVKLQECFVDETPADFQSVSGWVDNLIFIFWLAFPHANLRTGKGGPESWYQLFSWPITGCGCHLLLLLSDKQYAPGSTGWQGFKLTSEWKENRGNPDRCVHKGLRPNQCQIGKDEVEQIIHEHMAQKIRVNWVWLEDSKRDSATLKRFWAICHAFREHCFINRVTWK